MKVQIKEKDTEHKIIIEGNDIIQLYNKLVIICLEELANVYPDVYTYSMTTQQELIRQHYYLENLDG